MKQQYPRRGHQICQYFVAATEAREDVFYSASIALCCGIIKYSSHTKPPRTQRAEIVLFICT